MGVINKVVVKGVTYDIEDKINKDELLKRLQGTSENSDAMADPFKYIGASNSVELVNALNNTLSNGRYRVRLGNILLDLDVFVTSAADIAQLLRGFVTPIDDGWTTSLQYNEYHRIYHNGAWGSWEIIAGKNVKELLSQNTQDIVELQEQINNIEGVESVDITPKTTEVLLKVNDIQATFPAATTESAGVMSAAQCLNLATLTIQIQDLIARVEALENPSVVAGVSSNNLTFTNGAEVNANNLSLTGNNIDITNNNLNIK